MNAYLDQFTLITNYKDIPDYESKNYLLAIQ